MIPTYNLLCSNLHVIYFDFEVECWSCILYMSHNDRFLREAQAVCITTASCLVFAGCGCRPFEEFIARRSRVAECGLARQSVLITKTTSQSQIRMPIQAHKQDRSTGILPSLCPLLVFRVDFVTGKPRDGPLYLCQNVIRQLRLSW